MENAQKKKYRMLEKAKLTIALWVASTIMGAITMLLLGLMTQGVTKMKVDNQVAEGKAMSEGITKSEYLVTWIEPRVNLHKLVLETKSKRPQASVEEAEPEAKETIVEMVAAEAEAPTESPEIEPTAAPTAEPTPKKYVFLATAYSSAPEENGGWGAVDCKYGQPLPANAIAANLAVLPYGTRVYIEGVGERVVVDTASNATITKMEKRAADRGAYGWIDLYVGDDTPSAHAWGVRLVEITILEWGQGK